MRNFLIIISLFFFSSCAYSPIFKNLNDSNFFIEIESINGEQIINETIINKLNTISNIESENKIILEINTQYNKSVITKDKKGNPSTFKLSASSEIKIKYGSKFKNISISRNSSLQKSNDSFDTQIYERNIKENFGADIINELLTELYSLK
tara:strand:+ start:3469 stop:3921 length:453 start_codon:yes stop_codon:yes gene_type:complete